MNDREALIRTLRRQGIDDERVLAAVAAVPRDQFVAPEYRAAAWENHPLPIGAGQTISQPFVVAAMTQALGVGPGDSVLDVGTGCGYQAAVLAELGCQVCGVEVVPELADHARATLAALGYDVDVATGDGRLGRPDRAPFDAICVAAASDDVPDALLLQLREPGPGPGGRLILPLQVEWEQRLVRITRTPTGFPEDYLFGVRFVPLITP